MRRLAWLGGGAGALLVVAGVLVHLPGVQRELGGECPFGMDAPALAARPRTGPLPAGPRPALGFELERTTRADVEAWARSHGVACAMQRRGAVLECLAVPAVALGAASGLDADAAWFALDTAGVVRSVKTSRRAAGEAPVLASFRSIEARLVADAGPPVARAGDAAHLGRGAFEQVMIEHRRPGYRAVVRATNMGDGYLLTESYAAPL